MRSSYHHHVLLLLAATSCGLGVSASGEAISSHRHTVSNSIAHPNRIGSPSIHGKAVLQYRRGSVRNNMSAAAPIAEVAKGDELKHDAIVPRGGAANGDRGEESLNAEEKMDKALSRLGVGVSQIALILFVALVYAADGAELTALSLATKPLVEKWNLEVWQRGLLGSAIYSGMFTGSFLCGPIADLIGRKPTLLASTAIMASFGTLSGLLQNTSFVILCFIKILMGIGMGSSLPVVASMLQESLPQRIRGAIMCLVFAGFNIGEIYVAKMGAKRAGYPASSLFFIAAIPSLLSFLYSIPIPESPRFLASRGKKEALLRWFRIASRLNGKSTEDVLGKNVDVAVEDLCASTKKLPKKTTVDTSEKKENFVLAFIKKFGVILQGEARSKTLLLASLWMATTMVFYGLVFSLPELLESSKAFSGLESFNLADGYTLVNKYQPFILLFAVAAVGAGISYNVMFGVSYALSAVAFYLASRSFASPHLMAAFLACAKCLQNGVFTTLYPATGESFSTETRATGTSFCSMMGRGVAIGIAPICSFLLGRGRTAPLKAFALVSFLGAISSFLLCTQKEQSPAEGGEVAAAAA